MEKTLNFQPYGNYLLIKPDEQEKISEGGIYLPDQAQEKPFTATVIRVGLGQRYQPDCPEVPCFSKEGDKILVAKHTIREFVVQGIKLAIVPEGDVFGRFEVIDEDDDEDGEVPTGTQDDPDTGMD